MNVNTAYNIIKFIVNKQQTGTVSEDRVNYAMQIANSGLWKRYNGIPEQWQPGLPLAKIAYSINTDVEKVMSLFKTTTTLYINDFGVATKPSDFIKESTVTYITSKDGVLQRTPVDVCNDIEFSERQSSYVVAASKDNPACNFQSTTIRFAPLDLINVELLYLRMARTPVWAFTLSNNRPVYDAANSVDPEWPDDIINDFIMLACQQLGVNMQKDGLYQQMELYKQEGQ